MSDPSELDKFMRGYGVKFTPPKPKTQLQVPRISIFFGDDPKGEVSYQTWAYEVKCLQAEETYTDEILLQAIRRSLKGHAADQLRYIGVKPTIADILENFSSTYGTVETSESILKKFYACKQKPNETISKYCIRLEEIYAQAVEMKELKEGDDMLRRVFHRGLTAQLRHLTGYKFETVRDYRKFKQEVRQNENELEEDTLEDSSEDHKTKCQSINKKEDKLKSKIDQQFTELTSMMEKMNHKMEQLEKNQANTYGQQDQQSGTDQQYNIHQQTQPQYRQRNWQEQTNSQTHGQPPGTYSQPFGQQQHSYHQPQHNYSQPQHDYKQPHGRYNQPHGSHNQPQHDFNLTQGSYKQSQAQGGYSYALQQFRPVVWRGTTHFRGPRSDMPRCRGPFVGQGRGRGA